MSGSSGSNFPPNVPPVGGTPNSQGPSPSEIQADQELSNSPFAKMFPQGATPQELRMFINNFLQMMIYEFKQDDQKWQQAQDQLKKVEEGDDDS